MEDNNNENTPFVFIESNIRIAEPEETEERQIQQCSLYSQLQHLDINNVQSTSTTKNKEEAALEIAKLGTLQPLIIKSVIQSPVTSQPRCLLPTALPSPFSITLNQPLSLFIQAFSKLNESSINIAALNKLLSAPTRKMSGDISPPDSLTNAPPSYSFVLRQMAARRRPRLMGTFIPSPSFVQHTPPPNYATAFDIYVDNSVPPPPRAYHFGFAPMPAVCHECGYTGITVVTTKITVCTHMCAFLLCIFCCWICVPLPYVLRSCKDVYHHCRACRSYLGMYCPTNPESTTYS